MASSPDSLFGTGPSYAQVDIRDNRIAYVIVPEHETSSASRGQGRMMSTVIFVGLPTTDRPAFALARAAKTGSGGW